MIKQKKTKKKQFNGMCLSPTTGKQQQQQQQSSSSGSTTVKKQITPEMKRSRSQGTRNKLQKMHTIQSMASTDEGLINLGISLGSGGSQSLLSNLLFFHYYQIR